MEPLHGGDMGVVPTFKLTRRGGLGLLGYPDREFSGWDLASLGP